MRAAVLRGAGDITVEERPVPRPGPTAIALVASGRIDLDRLVTGTFRLDQTEEALTAARRDPQSVKAVIRPQT